MPEFSHSDYRLLLESLVEAGYRVRSVSTMGEPLDGPTVYLRHDVDFHLVGQDVMAEIDNEVGVESTFFILVSGHYNPFLHENRTIIERIAELGCEVGLHYDLRDYPLDLSVARQHLEFEADLVERLSGQPVTSICMHEPSAGHDDFFRSTDVYVHPHDLRWGEGLEYISDSCRAWRDERLLECFTEERPTRLLLNVHGELWLEPCVPDRIEYLQEVSAPTATASSNRMPTSSGAWASEPNVRFLEPVLTPERCFLSSGSGSFSRLPGSPS
jgi:hypothetical protein